MQSSSNFSLRRWSVLGAFVLSLCWAAISLGHDWPRFRGENGTGIAVGTAPVAWSDTENIKWKTELPGRGVSSPIVVGGKVFVTCYSGYGMGDGDAGDIENLKRHLVCVDRADGEVLWSKTVEAAMPEDPYSGIGVPRHGYASQSPACDGRQVFAFFGKTGVVAFDMEGNQLWQTGVGTESGRMRWGSAASLILHDDLVIVNASDESQALVGLNKATGKEVWRAEGSALESTWATPALMDAEGGKELVIGVPGEIWGLDPNTGKLKWYAEGFEGRSMCMSLAAGDGVVYCGGGNPMGSSFAVRTGGKDDVTESHVLWNGQGFARISSPVLYQGHLFGVDGGIAYCVNAETGERVYRTRLATGETAEDRSEAGGSARGGPPRGGFGGPRGDTGRGRGGFGGRGGGGGMGGEDYGSAVLADGKVYFLDTSGVTFIFAASPEFTLLAKNSLAADTSGFNSTPAISDGDLFLRSHKYLYCIAEE